MSVAIQVETFDRGATAQVIELERELSPSKLAATYGPRCRELTRNHLAALPDNKRGYPSTGFWEACARATRWERHGPFVKVIIAKVGARQRYLGGHIAPVNVAALTIPISPLSYGKTSKDFPGSFLISTPKGAYIVMNGNEGVNRGKPFKPEARRKRGGTALRASLIFLFKLSVGVDQAANPNVLPTPAEYRATVFAAARERLASIKSRNGGVTAT